MNRREALVSIAAASVAVPTATVAATGKGMERLEWNAAFARYENLKRQHDELERLHSAAWDRAEALKPSTDMIDRVNLPDVIVDVNRLEYTYDTEEAWTRFLANEGRTWWSRDPEATKARCRAALDTVDSYRQQRDHVRKLTKVDHYAEQLEAIDSQVSDAEDVLLTMPAPHGEALWWKVQRLYTPGDGIWAKGVEDQANADLKRFLLGAAA